jgi:hypothetical protein
MLIHTKNPGAWTVCHFRSLPAHVMLIPPFNGGWADTVCARQFALGDAAIMRLKDFQTIGL